MNKIKQIIIEFRQIVVGWHITRLKKKAERLRVSEKSQMFVLRLNGRIRIISRKWYKENKRKGVFPKHFTVDDLKRISFYYTGGA